MMYSITLFQKSYILSKCWVGEKSPNVGGRIKRVAQGLKGGKKLFSSLRYIYFQEIKKILYVLHVRVNLEIKFLTTGLRQLYHTSLALNTLVV